MKVRVHLQSQKLFGKKGKRITIEIDDSFCGSPKEVRDMVLRQKLKQTILEEIKPEEFQFNF